MIWHRSSDHVRSLWRVELNLLGINLVLDLVLQIQTVIRVVSKTIRMVCTPFIGMIGRSRSVGGYGEEP